VITDRTKSLGHVPGLHYIPQACSAHDLMPQQRHKRAHTDASRTQTPGTAASCGDLHVRWDELVLLYEMASWRRPFGGRTEAAGTVPLDEGEVSDGSLHYVVEKGGNDSQPSYQEATGAPVEVDSPLGYNVGAITIIFLNISKMIGTGVYSTRKPRPH